MISAQATNYFADSSKVTNVSGTTWEDAFKQLLLQNLQQMLMRVLITS